MMQMRAAISRNDARGKFHGHFQRSEFFKCDPHFDKATGYKNPLIPFGLKIIGFEKLLELENRCCMSTQP